MHLGVGSRVKTGVSAAVSAAEFRCPQSQPFWRVRFPLLSGNVVASRRSMALHAAP